MAVSGNENLIEYHEGLLESLCEEEKCAEDHERFYGGADEDVVYIGDKPKKTINYNGRGFTFFRLAAAPVPAAVAAYLLGFKGVFSSVGDMELELKSIQQIKQHKDLADESLRLVAQQRQQQQDELIRTTVRIGNNDIDLAKLTSIQMRDFAEDHGIDPRLLPPAPADMRIYLINHFSLQGKTA